MSRARNTHMWHVTGPQHTCVTCHGMYTWCMHVGCHNVYMWHVTWYVYISQWYTGDMSQWYILVTCHMIYIYVPYSILHVYTICVKSHMNKSFFWLRDGNNDCHILVCFGTKNISTSHVTRMRRFVFDDRHIVANNVKHIWISHSYDKETAMTSATFL